MTPKTTLAEILGNVDTSLVYLGQPCKNCRCTIRWIIGRTCIECGRRLTREWRARKSA